MVVTKLYRCDELTERGDISIGKTGDVDTGYASVGMGGRPGQEVVVTTSVHWEIG